MGKTVSIDGLADAVMEELSEYNKLAGETMKKAVTKAGQTVRKEIKAGAPCKVTLLPTVCSGSEPVSTFSSGMVPKLTS